MINLMYLHSQQYNTLASSSTDQIVSFYFHLNIITQEFILFFVNPLQSSNDFNARWRENKAVACIVKHFIIKEVS